MAALVGGQLPLVGLFMLKNYLQVPSGVCGIILIVCGSFIGLFFDPIVNSIINNKMVIRNGSAIYGSWSKPPIVPYANVYLFNLTNADDFVNGEMPHFQEIGPFAYRQHWEKVNIVFHDNGTVSYGTKKHFYFDLSKSIGPEDVIIHTLNVPLNAAVDKVKNMGTLYHLALDSMLTMLNQNAVVQRSVREIIWGYPDPLLTIGSRFLPNVPYDKMGFFYGKNGSTDGHFNVNTGENGFTNYTLINTYNLSKKLKFWKTSECNMLNGTDGLTFPPSIAKHDTIYLFNENLCRSLPLNYNMTVKRYGLTTYRFTVASDVFAHASEKPENDCYCVSGQPCNADGILNISGCKYGTPTMLSFPHFLYANEKYLRGLTGLKPDPTKHMSYIDVQPKLGTSLAAEFRFQLNFQTTRLENIVAVMNITEMVFPAMWFEEAVTSLPNSMVDRFRKTLILPSDIKLFLLVLFFVCGGIMSVGAILAFTFLDQKVKSKAAMICNLPACLPLTTSSSDFDDDTNTLTSPNKISPCSSLLYH